MNKPRIRFSAIGLNHGHLFLVNQRETCYFDCSAVPLTYGAQLLNDIINRTETAMSQAHCLLATEPALKAQQQAQRLKNRQAI
jgi:hypothetical protein